MVFHDRSPAATAHLQVVPREHIDNLDSLRPSSQDHELGGWQGERPCPGPVTWTLGQDHPLVQLLKGSYAPLLLLRDVGTPAPLLPLLPLTWLVPTVSCPGAVAEMIETGRRVLQELHPGAPQWLGFHKASTACACCAVLRRAGACCAVAVPDSCMFQV